MSNSQNMRYVTAEPRPLTNAHVIPIPVARKIPIPEHYPKERTSTSSFKAPVTMANAKRKAPDEAPSASNTSTLSTAIGYISTPVKYISSMFSAPAPPPEPVKIKTKPLFKIDIEKEERQRERQHHQLVQQTSPRSSTFKKVENTAASEESTGSLAPKSHVVPAEKDPVPAWKRRNLMPETLPQISPNLKTQLSPKRATQVTPAHTDPASPTHVSQLKIKSSAKLNSFKVRSKSPPLEPVKTTKKDPRKIIKSGRRSKEPTAQTVSQAKAMNLKYNPPKKLNKHPPSLEDDLPIVLYPTVLPPRIPPATYTIRSQPIVEQEQEGQREAETATDPDIEQAVEKAMSSSPDRPELMSCQGPTLEPTWVGGSALEEEEEFKVEETAALMINNESVKVLRLDQLSDGIRLGKAGGQSGLRNLFPDATLMKNDVDDLAFNASCVDPADIVLCAASYRPPPSDKSYKLVDTTKTEAIDSTTKTEAIDRTSSPNAKGDKKFKSSSVSPNRKQQSPSIHVPETKALPTRNRLSPGRETKKHASSKKSSSSNIPKDANFNSPHANREVSPIIKKSNRQNERVSPQRRSPLKVEEKYRSAIKDNFGKIANDVKPAGPFYVRTQSPRKEVQTNTSTATIKPNVVKMTITKPKEKSPGKNTTEKTKEEKKPTKSNSLYNVPAVAAVATAATAAVTSILKQQHQQQQQQQREQQKEAPGTETQTKTSSPVRSEKGDTEGNLRSQRSPPQIFKMDKGGKLQQSSPPQKSPAEPMIQAPEVGDNKGKEEESKSDNGENRRDSKLKEIVKRFKSPTRKVVPDPMVPVEDTANSAPATVCAEESEENNCIDNYCGDPARYAKAVTMMGEIP